MHFLATPPRCSRGRLAPRTPSRGARAQDTAHAAIAAPGPASCGPTRALYAMPAPLGPLADRGRLARCPGYPLSDTHRSQPRSQPSTGLLHPSKWVSSLHSHQQQNDLHVVNLTNTLTHITLTPGSLGRESLLPPITHRTMHSPITPFSQTRWPHSPNMFPLPFHTSTLITELCHSAHYTP